MAVVFSVAKTFQEAIRTEEVVCFEEEIEKILKEKQWQAIIAVKYFLRFNPYGDKILNREEIHELYFVCKTIEESFTEEVIKQFVTNIQKLCVVAIQTDSFIFALGD